MNKNNTNQFLATAFVSCSLREEDKTFIDLIERILIQHRIKPVGTVGKYSVSPINIADHMKRNIPLADILVIVATPRYLQKDLHTNEISYGLSESVHVEAGMAFMANKPVVVFVQEGTHVGNFLPNVTQFITLNGLQSDLENKWNVINSLINNTYAIVRKIKEQLSTKQFEKNVKTGLAIFGGIALLDSLFTEEPPKRRTTSKRKL